MRIHRTVSAIGNPLMSRVLRLEGLWRAVLDFEGCASKPNRRAVEKDPDYPGISTRHPLTPIFPKGAGDHLADSERSEFSVRIRRVSHGQCRGPMEDPGLVQPQNR